MKTYNFNCDECPENDEFEGSNVARAWEAAKEAGWRSKLVGGQWLRFCPSCVEDFGKRSER